MCLCLIVSFVFTAAATIWVAIDARRRDWSNDRFANRTWKWVLGTLVVGAVVFPLYLVHRGQTPLKAAPLA